MARKNPSVEPVAELISMSKEQLIAHGASGGQAQIDAGLEMYRRAVKRQTRKQQA